MADAPAGRPEAIHIMNGQEPGPQFVSYARPVPQRQRLPVTDPLNAFVDDMAEVRKHGRIVLYCGEAHPYVYNSPEFLGMAREVAHTQKAKITAITGPVMLVPDDERQHNGLIQLVKEGTLKGLYHRQARFLTGHFRVVETDGLYKLYREQSHAPGERVENRWCDDFRQHSGESIQALAHEALDLFAEWKTMAVPHEDAIEQGLPLITTPVRLAKIVDHLTAKSLDFNYLEASEIVAAVEELGPGVLEPLATYRLQAWRAVPNPNILLWIRVQRESRHNRRRRVPSGHSGCRSPQFVGVRSTHSTRQGQRPDDRASYRPRRCAAPVARHTVASRIVHLVRDVTFQIVHPEAPPRGVTDPTCYQATWQAAQVATA